MSLDVHLDEGALRAMLRSPIVRAAVRGEAEKVAAGVDRQAIQVGDLESGSGLEVNLPVLISEEYDDDGGLGIYLAHPAGVAVEAQRGALARAAAGEGLKLGPKPSEGL
jgi:hypothetical protein